MFSSSFSVDVERAATQFLKSGISFNTYMFHGGTNFGFMNGGVNMDSYHGVVTSYGKCWWWIRLSEKCSGLCGFLDMPVLSMAETFSFSFLWLFLGWASDAAWTWSSAPSSPSPPLESSERNGFWAWGSFWGSSRCHQGSLGGGKSTVH